MSENNLISKVAAACDAVGGVAKQGRNTMQNYDYVKAADVAKAIRHELFSRGVVLIPHESQPDFVNIELAPDRDGRARYMTECRLCVTYSLTDGLESRDFNAYGVARDSGDKSIYKAKTGALKYFLRGLGLIPDEADDPENEKADNRRTKSDQEAFAQQRVADVKAGIAPVAENTIGPNKQKELWRIAKKLEWEEAALRDLLGSYGYEKTAEVTNANFGFILDVLDPDFKEHPAQSATDEVLDGLNKTLTPKATPKPQQRATEPPSAKEGTITARTELKKLSREMTAKNKSKYKIADFDDGTGKGGVVTLFVFDTKLAGMLNIGHEYEIEFHAKGSTFQLDNILAIDNARVIRDGDRVLGMQGNVGIPADFDQPNATQVGFDPDYQTKINAEDVEPFQ